MESEFKEEIERALWTETGGEGGILAAGSLGVVRSILCQKGDT